MTRAEFIGYLNMNGYKYRELDSNVTDMVLVNTKSITDGKYVAVSNFGGKRVTVKTRDYRFKVETYQLISYISEKC